MLFSTIDEFKEHVPVNSGLKFATIKRDIKRVERKYLIPYLGQEQYDALNTAYNSGDVSDELDALLDYARDIVALFTLGQCLPIIQVQVSDAGIKSSDTDTEKSIAQWKVDDLSETYCQKLGWEAVEEMMKFLELHPDDYALWAADTEASTIHKQFIINTTKDFGKHYWINDSPLTFKALEPSMRNVQLMDLNGWIGEDLLDRILTEISGEGDVSDDVEFILKWLKPMFANLVVSRGLKELYISMRPDGIYANNYKTDDRQNNRDRSAATAMQMQYVNDALTQASFYGKELNAYLQANATADKYPEFFESSLYVAVAPTDEEIDAIQDGKFFRF